MLRWILRWLSRGLHRIAYLLFTSPIGWYVVARLRKRSPYAYAEPFSHNNRRIVPFAVLNDNVCYAVCHGKHVVFIDAVAPERLSKFMEHENLSVDALLTTHRHWDHAGGNRLWLQRLGPHTLSVMGHTEFTSLSWWTKQYMGINRTMSHNQSISIAGMTFRALEAHWHTCGHTLFLLESQGDGPSHLFTGDAFFVNGIGKFFEGEPHALYDFIATHCHPENGDLPQDTIMWPGHDYALGNIRFSLSLCHGDKQLNQLHQAILKAQDDSQLFLPRTLAQEISTNLYFRVALEETPHEKLWDRNVLKSKTFTARLRNPLSEQQTSMHSLTKSLLQRWHESPQSSMFSLDVEKQFHCLSEKIKSQRDPLSIKNAIYLLWVLRHLKDEFKFDSIQKD